MYKVKTKSGYFNQGKVYETKQDIEQDLFNYYSQKNVKVERLSLDELLVLADMKLVIANPVQCKATFKLDGENLEIFINNKRLGTTLIPMLSQQVKKEIFNG